MSCPSKWCFWLRWFGNLTTTAPQRGHCLAGLLPYFNTITLIIFQLYFTNDHNCYIYVISCDEDIYLLWPFCIAWSHNWTHHICFKAIIFLVIIILCIPNSSCKLYCYNPLPWCFNSLCFVPAFKPLMIAVRVSPSILCTCFRWLLIRWTLAKHIGQSFLTLFIFYNK